MTQPALSSAPDERSPRSGSSWASGEAANDPPALDALLYEVRCLRDQLASMEAGRPGSSVRDRERLTLGRDAVLSIGRAAELLPLADGEAKAWLREQSLVSTIETGGRTRELVHWGSVIDHLGSPRPAPARRTRQPNRRRSGLPRVDLG